MLIEEQGKDMDGRDPALGKVSLVFEGLVEFLLLVCLCIKLFSTLPKPNPPLFIQPNLTTTQQLVIKKETYESIDEIIARFLSPLIAYTQDIQTHRKFREGPREEAEAEMLALRTKSPKSIPYFLVHNPSLKGSYHLVYQNSTRPKRFRVLVSHKGIKLGNKLLTSAKSMEDWFKKNFKKLEQEQREEAQRVKAKSEPVWNQTYDPYGSNDARNPGSYSNQGYDYSSNQYGDYDNQQRSSQPYHDQGYRHQGDYREY